MTQAQGLGLLLAMMDAGSIPEAELNAWYDDEHVPERRELPGFLTVQRYVCLKGEPKYLALYDLDSPEVLRSAAYLALGDKASDRTKRILAGVTGRRRSVYVQSNPGRLPAPAAGGLLLFEFDIGDAAAVEEVEEWYDAEHLPLLRRIPGVLAARRFQAVAANPQFLALYHLTEAEAARHPGWKAAADTPWSQRLISKMTHVNRKVYRAIAAR